jgi:hypothetical protein
VRGYNQEAHAPTREGALARAGTRLKKDLCTTIIPRWAADRAVDKIRDRFGWDAIGYGSVVLGLSRSVPDEFRELAEKDL